MRLRVYSAVSAAALSLSLLAGSVSAQELGLKQAQDSAIAGMSQLNMDVSMVGVLTLDELTQIQAVTGGGDSDQIKVGRIDTILRDAEARIAAGGAVAPTGAVGDVSADDLEGDMVVKANVGAFIAQLGLNDRIDVDTLTTEQLLQLQLISESSEDQTVKRTRVEEMLIN